jgi:putative ABC transport system ATP-binding protein
VTPNDVLAAECREVVQVYPSASGPVHALREISFGVPKGSLTVVIGPSGAGKSTLLRLLGGLERPTVGEVLIGGERTEHLSGRARRRMVGRRIGHVFQMPAQNLLDYLDVTEHVRLAWRMRVREQPGAVEQLVEQSGLADVAALRPRELAAGQQQRLAFAMAVAGDPALVVADEPTASLDPDGAAILVALLDRLRLGGQTMVIASHDDRLMKLADQVLVIRGGVLVAAGPPGALGPPAVIDASGRLALDPDSLARFPDGRVRIVPDGEGGGVRVVRP